MSLGDIEIAIKGLDEVVGKRIKSPSLFVVGGHPGAGKTTFAATICVNNARRSGGCLYVSFQEDLEKLSNSLGVLGKSFKELVTEGRIRYVRLPMTLDVDDIIGTITDLVEEVSPRIIVVDPINIPLEAIGLNKRTRALLQNFFHDLPRTINGLVILLAELPTGELGLKLGDIEFVADALFVLKYRIEDSIIIREMEIRKFRGVPFNVAQFPFSITPRGIRVYPPISIKEIKRIDKTLFKTISGKLEMTYNGLRRGEMATVFYPPCCQPLHALLLLLEMLKRYKLRGLLISYWVSEHELKTLLSSILEHDFNMDHAKASSVIEEYIPGYLDVVSINPLRMSSPELVATEIEEIEKRNPDMVVYLYPEVLEHIYGDRSYIRHVLNKVLYLKRSGKLIINLISRINDFIYNIYASLSDAVFEVVIGDGTSGEAYICVSRPGRGRRCHRYEEVVDSQLLEKLYNSLVRRGGDGESDTE